MRFLTILSIFLLFSCTNPKKTTLTKCLKVKASAYNSLPYQTRPGSAGNITAWGDTLTDSIPSIAISRDLLDSGLVYGTLVKLHGYRELFVVNDKMNRRYRNKVDIHFGKDVKAAREFGNKRIKICWEIPDTAANQTSVENQ